MIRQLFLLFFCLIAGLARSQEAKDSIAATPRVPTLIRYQTEADYRDRQISERAPDTSVSRLHEVFITDNGETVHLGNTGSALNSIWFRPLTGLTTSLGINAYSAYGSGPEEQSYYRTNKRYSRIDFWQGAFRESGIRFLHTQNVNRQLNLGLTIDRFTVKEFLPEGDTYFNRISLFGSYESPNRRYRLFAHTSWMRIKNQVNGGLSNDSAFLAGSVDNLGLKGSAIRLSDADQRIRRRELYLSQYYNFGHGDATDSLFVPWRLGWSLRYRRDSFTYLDNASDSSYYADFFLNTSESYDSSLTDQLSNRIALERVSARNAAVPLSFQVYVEDQRINAYQSAATDWYNQVAGLTIRLGGDSTKIRVRLHAAQVISGRDQENREWQAQVAGKLLHDLDWYAAVAQEQTAVPFIFQRYSGNHLQWDNDFTSQQVGLICAGIKIPKWRLGLTARALQLEDYLYVGYDQKPAQLSGSVNGVQAELSKEFRFRKWGFGNIVRFQSFDATDQLRVPELLLQHALFFEDALFNKALVLRTGIDAWYCSEWNGAAYSPSTSLYYLQKTSTTGGYLRTDLFLNLKIKTAGIFLRFTNLTDGLGAKAYELVPGYPQPGRVFHFGVRWMFFDQ